MKNVFVRGKNPDSRAYYGWQNGDLSMFGLREGYKEVTDNLVTVVLYLVVDVIVQSAGQWQMKHSKKGICCNWGRL